MIWPICWGSLPNKLFQRPPRGTDKWIWNTAFTIFSFTVTLFSHNMLAMHWSLCFELFPLEGEDGQRGSKSFVRPQYVPVSRKQFETIEVNIKRDTGESVPSEFGRVLLTLHFRQSQPQYF